MKEIDRIIEEIDRLQPVSTIGNRIIETSSNQESSLNDLVDVIRFDQGITANLLKICNSSYFGLKRRMESLKQAVAFLGIEKVAGLVMMGNAAGNFKKAQKGYDLTEGDLWRYSVSSALIAQDLAEKKQFTGIPLIFTSALLKDIGKVILNAYVDDAFEEIMEAVKGDRMTFIEAEREIIGIDHAELGSRVAEKWNFSQEMVDIIKFHHTPEMADPDNVSLRVIYLADSICMMIGIGVGSDGLAYKHDQDILDGLGFSDVDVQMTIAGFWEKLNGVEELVNLSQGVN